MLGNHSTVIRLVLAYTQSLQKPGSLSEFRLEEVIPAENYFTRLSFEQSPNLKHKFFNKTKYEDVMDWAASQSNKASDIKGLSLQFIPQGSDDIMTSGFVGGGRILCLQHHFNDKVVTYLYKSDLAKDTPSLRPEDKRDDMIIWDDVLMIAHPPKTTTFTHILSIDAASNQLDTALTNIKNYALEHTNKKSWAAIFLKSLDILEGRKIDLESYANFSDVSKHLSSKAQNLLHASSSAWVFGGMGSWNDGESDGNYHEVTCALFNAIHESYVSVCAYSLKKCAARLN